jgi:hypothetical protein
MSPTPELLQVQPRRIARCKQLRVAKPNPSLAVKELDVSASDSVTQPGRVVVLVLGDQVFQFFGHFKAEIEERLHAASDLAAVRAIVERQADGLDCVVGHPVSPRVGKSPAFPAGCEPNPSAVRSY